MSEFIEAFIKKNSTQFKKYKSYIESNDWTQQTIDSILKDEYFNELYSEDKNKVKKAEATKLFAEFIKQQKDTVKGKADEWKLQNDLIEYILNRVSIFVKKAQGDHNNPKFKRFIKFCLGIVKTHTDRIEEYLYSIDITKIENQEVRSEEIKLTKDCHAGANKIEETITNLSIREDQATEGIRWLDEQKATLAMYETLVGQYPEIKTKLDAIGIDFDASPEPTLHILNPNPPEYNPEKNFWEQAPEVLRYYISEYKKIENGVTIDDYYIDGWLYYHFNFFVTKIPTTIVKNGIKENKDATIVPELRDNEMIITDYFNKSRRDQKMSLIAATRRAAKTTLNSSRMTRAQMLGKKQILCAGGSSEDLGHISLNIKTCNENINPAFRLYYLSKTDDQRGDCYGIKTKSNKSKIVSNIFIINLEGGTKKGKKESLAGFTPDEFILDEAMKFPFKSQLQALEPALWGVDVLRCDVLITGTGGDEDLAADAIEMLNFPEDNKITLMDWDTLEKHVPKNLITWKRKKFGLFLPTQMCIKHKKVKSNMADYLGIVSETLSKVPVWMTDWETSKIREEEERKSKIKNKKDYTRLLAYHPFDPEEIFLSGKMSPFHNVIEQAKSHRNYLLETGAWDCRRKLWKNSNGQIMSEISTDELVPFPFNGATQYAPYLIIEPPDYSKVPKYYYVASGDFYKQDETTSTDSVGTIIIYKYPLFGDPSGKKIVATYAARPKKHKEFNEAVLILLEYYNAVLFPENEDLGQFKTFLEEKKIEEQFLERHIDFNSTLTYSENPVRAWGWTPKQSKQKLMAMFANYLDEDVISKNDNDEEIRLKRVQTIDDIHLLSEIISYTDRTNCDRISGALGGVGLIHFLEKNYIYPKGVLRRNDGEEEDKKPKKERERQFYSSANREKSFYRRR